MDPARTDRSVESLRSVRSVTRLGCWLTGPLWDSEGISLLERVSSLAVAAEVSGFDSFWVSDLVPSATVGASGPRGLEAYSLLGALAARTRTMRLGAVPFTDHGRPPSMVAKMVAGIDVISHGRGILAVALGEGDADEGGAVVEALQVSRAMMEDDLPTFTGSVHGIKEAFNRPRPVQSGGIPLVLVVSNSASRRAGAIAAAARRADAVIMAAPIGTIRAQIAGIAAFAAIGGGGSTPSPVRAAVIGVGAGLPKRPLAVPQEPMAMHRQVKSVRDLFEAGVDGCLVPVDVRTMPEDLIRTGEELASFRSTPP